MGELHGKGARGMNGQRDGGRQAGNCRPVGKVRCVEEVIWDGLW